MAGLVPAAALLALAPEAAARPQPTRNPANRQPAAGKAKPPATKITPVETATTDAELQPAAVEPPAGTDEITLSAFSEPVELTALVEYVSRALELNVTVKGSLNGTVAFNAPVSVPRARLLKLLDALLEQQGYTITYDPESQFYTVHPLADVVFNPTGEIPTTRLISTPNVRPSYLKAAIDSQFFVGAGGQPQAPNQQGQTQVSKGIAYLDELGVIVVTESPRRVAAIEALVHSLLENYEKAEYTRLELRHVAAPQARYRALQLVGQTTGQSTAAINPQTGEPMQQGPGGLGSSRGIDNLSERLTVDPLGNALIFRGSSEEIDQVRKILDLIDAPNTLKPLQYEVGSRAKQIADIARLRGLGEVTLISAPQQQGLNQGYPVYIDPSNNPAQNQRAAPSAGGPVMVIDEKLGTIVYYGTEAQHAALRELIEQLNVEDERVTIRAYKLKHSDAEQMSELILNLIQNTKPVGSAPLLTEGGGGFSAGAVSRTGYRNTPARSTATPTGGGGDEGLFISGEEAFVLPNKANNQVLIKAPGREQKDFARLIETLDLRKPQVFIEAKIIAVSAGEQFRLAFETQLINANGTGGVYDTNFNLSVPSNSPNASQPILNPKTVLAGLTGFSSALILSDQVPIIIRALAEDSDTRILSTPQILVDDNEKASVASVDQQPTTTTTTTSGNPSETSFGGYVDAGTNFEVTPHISSGGYLRLQYEIKLSSFTGTGSNGVPPPKLENVLKSDSVTVPGNMTIVIGGLVLDSKSKTVVKVPLLGDIPIIGALFSDQNKQDRQTTLYVFLTPRILQDPTLDDYLLITKGPQAAVELESDTPELTPTIMQQSAAMPVPLPVNAPVPPPEPAPAPVEPLVPLIEVPAPAATGSTDGKGLRASARH